MILDIFRNGKYSSLQWLAIAPLLALTSSVTMGVTAGLLMLLLLSTFAMVFSVTRRLVPHPLRLFIIVLILGTVISLTDMGMQFFYYEISESIGIYLPLLAVNSLIFAITEDCFFRDGFRESLRQALLTGVMCLALFVILGMIREAAGYGMLLRDAEMVNGIPGRIPVPGIAGEFTGIALIHEPPGALLACGLLAAVIRYIFRDYRPDASANAH